MNNETDKTNELDDFKSLWKFQKDEKSYDSSQIFNMIHKKSINSVQWLFIISIIELLLGVFFSLWTLISGKHLYSKDALELIGKETLGRFENASQIGLIGSLIFIVIIYFFYRRISSDLSVKELINNIIKFRKTVIWFLVTWFIIAVSLLSPIYYQMGKNAYLNKATGKQIPIEELESTANGVGWGFTIALILIILICCGLYYLIIYGFFLRRLNKNLKELKKIEA